MDFDNVIKVIAEMIAKSDEIMIAGGSGEEGGPVDQVMILLHLEEPLATGDDVIREAQDIIRQASEGGKG